MAGGSFQTFSVGVEIGNGQTTPVPGITLKIYNVTDNVASEVTVTSDANGDVIGANISDVPAGKLVHFRVENDGAGRSGYVDQVLIP